MKRKSDKRPAPPIMPATEAAEAAVDATGTSAEQLKEQVKARAKAGVKRVLESGKASDEELARLRAGRVDHALERDPDWPARQAAWNRLCALLGLEGRPELDARTLEHKHWAELQRQRHGKVGSKLRDINAVLDDTAEFEK